MSSTKTDRSKWLTDQELLEWARTHPAPVEFWEGDDDPSKPEISPLLWNEETLEALPGEDDA